MNVKRLLGVVIASGALLIPTAANAAVTFDSTTGTGFVGKGDVQLAYGWNDAKLQANAAGVTFSYDTKDTYAATCTWTTGEGTRGERTHNVNHNRSTAVNSSIAYEARKNSQGKITGFNLNGFGSETSDGAAPVVGEACPGNPGTDGLWTAVSLDSSTGGLFVHYGGTGVLL